MVATGNKYVNPITPKNSREEDLNERERKNNDCEERKNNRTEMDYFGAIRIRLGAIKFCLAQVCGNQIVVRGAGEVIVCAGEAMR